jgi:hypothetical protein
MSDKSQNAKRIGEDNGLTGREKKRGKPILQHQVYAIVLSYTISGMQPKTLQRAKYIRERLEMLEVLPVTLSFLLLSR